ncbi:protein PLANT CADMIUM RESISTANCE 7-like [Vitis riparia]|uniref:protein PLANT CADMIUM RESISTANCE 7-like n=1 Tax=Vitis riparia TaxID=96939 RepID=UPI00155AD7D5|nr:protein PLANT CADMIUM RESISTANCE 7-like [Vitis riparia]
MGRIQEQTHLPHASQPEATAQASSRSPSHHSYHPPETGINSLPQLHQSDPVLTTQNNAVGIPSQTPFQNNLQHVSPLQANNENTATGYWSTGLFDCMDDPNIALTTAIFPCVTFGQIADVLDNGHTTCATSGIIYALAACLLSWPYRGKLRQRFGLMEAPAPDCMVHCLFEPCALCQEYRELKNRGINPALGYHGNMNQLCQNPPDLATMVPPTNQTIN